MIITRLKGGMGNQMFQYAIGRAMAIKYEVTLGLDLSSLLDRNPRPEFYSFTYRNYDLDVFNIKATIVPELSIPFFYRPFKSKLVFLFAHFYRKTFKLPGVEKMPGFDSKILNVGPDAYLDGRWLSPKYFSNIEDTIRADFTLKDELPEKIRILRKEIIEKKSLCIHVRRGDFIGDPKRDVVGSEYYNAAIERVKSKTEIDCIYLFSDDIKWCEENLSFPYPTIFVGQEYAGKKAEGHLALMSACHNFIIPNSSFAWWAAWLNPSKTKIVIVPEKWFGNRDISSNDLIPWGWISM